MRESKQLSLFAVVLGTFTALAVVFLEWTNVVLFSTFAIMFTAFSLGVIAYLKYRSEGGVIELFRKYGVWTLPQPIVLVASLFLIVLLRVVLVRLLGIEISQEVTLFALACMVVASMIYGIVRQMRIEQGENNA